MNHSNLRIIFIKNNGSSLQISAVPDDPTLYYWRQNADLFTSSSLNDLSKISPTQFIFAELPVINWIGNKNNKNGQLIFAIAPSESGNWKGAIGSEEKYGKNEYLFDINATSYYGININKFGPASPYLIDKNNYLIIQLVTGELESINSTELLNGQNLALLGNEIIQFQTAQLIGDKVYKLSNFIRGLFGTEFYISKHKIGENFILLNERLAAINIENNEISVYKKIRINSFRLNEDQAGEIDLSVQNYGLLPYSISNLKVKYSGNSYLFSWLPRVRFDGEWLDHRDVIDPDPQEEYKIVIDSQEFITNKREFFYNGSDNMIELKIYRLSFLSDKSHGIKAKIDLKKELILDYEFI